MKSSYIGVRWSLTSKKWVAICSLKRKTLYLGRFDDEISAAKRYDEFKRSLGIYTKLNFNSYKNQFECVDNYVKIKLTKNQYALVDIEDFDLVKKYKWHAVETGNLFYAMHTLQVEGKKTGLLMHRLILNTNDSSQIVDHRNGIATDNRKSNLRITDHKGNSRNSKGKNTIRSPYKGVFFEDNRYRARIRIDKKPTIINLGSYINPKDAARAYNTAAVKYFGEFARLNIIEEADE